MRRQGRLIAHLIFGREMQRVDSGHLRLLKWILQGPAFAVDCRLVGRSAHRFPLRVAQRGPDLLNSTACVRADGGVADCPAERQQLGGFSLRMGNQILK